MSFSRLPNEIVFMIAENLRYHPEERAQHLNSFHQVNRRLNSLFSTDLYKIAATTTLTGGKSVLHWAAEYHGARLVSLLLEHGSIIDARDIMQRTPLHYAAKYNSRQVIKLLIEKGANTEARDNRYGENATPLHVASKAGNEEAVKLLLTHGVDINALARHKNTALHLAVQYEKKNIVDLLLSQGADINPRNDDFIGGNTPLHIAAKLENEEISVLLITHGADFTIENRISNAPEYTAVRVQRIGMIRARYSAKAPNSRHGIHTLHSTSLNPVEAL